MTNSRTARTAGSRSLLRPRWVALLLGILSLAGLGCGVRHLGPNSGQAFRRVFAMQAQPHLSQSEQAQPLGAEDAEVVMANMREQTKRGDGRGARAATQMLLPISR